MTGPDALNEMFVNAPIEAILYLADLGHMAPGGLIVDAGDSVEYNLIRKIFLEGNVKIRLSPEPRVAVKQGE